MEKVSKVYVVGRSILALHYSNMSGKDIDEEIEIEMSGT